MWDLANGFKLLLAIVFTVSGLLKLRSTATPQLDLLAFIGISQTYLVRLLLRALPILELLLALWLFSSWLPLFALGASAILLGVFSCVLVAAVRAHYGGTCACFGS